MNQTLNDNLHTSPGEIAIEIYDVPLRTPRLITLWGTPLMVLVVAPWILVRFGNIPLDTFVGMAPVKQVLMLCMYSFILYFTQVLGRNKTMITKRSGMIEILYGPIPVPLRPRVRSFRVDEITHIKKEDSVFK